MTLCTNVVCTCELKRCNCATDLTNYMITALIAYRILSIQRAIHGLAQVNTARSALMMILESAAVYSASVVSLMITYTLNSNAQYTVLDLVSSESFVRVV